MHIEEKITTPWNDKHHTPLTTDGISIRGMKRLLRARRNGGNIRAILKRYGK